MNEASIISFGIFFIKPLKTKVPKGKQQAAKNNIKPIKELFNFINFKIVNTGINIIGVGKINPNSKNKKIKFCIFLDKKCIENANIDEKRSTNKIDKEVNNKLLINDVNNKSSDLLKILK